MSNGYGKWMEEGERNTAYFCKSEKQRQIKNSISSLVVDNKECRVSKQIDFYRKMYEHSYIEDETLLNWFQHEVPKIEDVAKKFEKGLRLAKLNGAIRKMHLNCSPVPDGLASHFYQHFVGNKLTIAVGCIRRMY